MDELLGLKQQIVEEIGRTISNSSVDPLQKFELFMYEVENSQTTEAMRKAFLAAKEIEDSNSKSEALTRLIESVDLALAANNQPSETESEEHADHGSADENQGSY